MLNTEKLLTAFSVRRAADITIHMAVPQIWAVATAVMCVKDLYVQTAAVNVWAATLSVAVSYQYKRVII